MCFWYRENERRLKDNRITQSHPSCTLKAKCSIPLFKKRLAIGFDPVEKKINKSQDRSNVRITFTTLF